MHCDWTSFWGARHGHCAGGFGFGPRGEENAWHVHSQMFTWDARLALTTETRGQNNWLNFGRHNYDDQGRYRSVAPANRQFAMQKLALLPEEFVWRPVEESCRRGGGLAMR